MPMSHIEIRPCRSIQDYNLCVELQRDVWKFEDVDLVPSAIFVVAEHTGGHSYLAFDGDRAVGFALDFSAEHGGHRYLHSHMAGVLPEYQNRGVGRLLKLHQRDQALREGIDTIEWTFDPLEIRNAHFNIARLGAIVRKFIPDCYGTSTSPLHANFVTDRLVAEWQLRSARVERAIRGEAEPPSEAIEIRLPNEIRELKSSDPDRVRQIQTDLRNQFTDLFARGYAVTGFRRDREHGVYLLEPYED